MTTRRTSKAENDNLWLISTLLILPLVLGGSVYLVILRSMDVTKSENELVAYAYSVAFLAVIINFGIHEVLYSRKVSESLTLHLKRFVIRSSVLVVYWVFLLGFWLMLNYLLTGISWKYDMLLSLIFSTILLGVFLNVPRVKSLLTKFEERK